MGQRDRKPERKTERQTEFVRCWVPAELKNVSISIVAHTDYPSNTHCRNKCMALYSSLYLSHQDEVSKQKDKSFNHLHWLSPAIGNCRDCVSSPNNSKDHPMELLNLHCFMNFYYIMEDLRIVP